MVLTRENAEFVGELPRLSILAAEKLHHRGAKQHVGQKERLVEFFRTQECGRSPAPALLQLTREVLAHSGRGGDSDERVTAR